MGRLAGKSLPKSHGWIAKTGPAVNKDIRPKIKRLNPDLRADGIMLVAQKSLRRARTSLLPKLSDSLSAPQFLVSHSAGSIPIRAKRALGMPHREGEGTHGVKLGENPQSSAFAARIWTNGWTGLMDRARVRGSAVALDLRDRSGRDPRSPTRLCESS